ncbi:prephenate dehydrogenase [Actinopolymorpha cephalotaxi]|uniref:Prephenate dehydrogenase n=1 Tax=Actinopolymorpha cephalotaxi TaxID=504797 RepID=A0A1I2VQP7_9ACTN|nr:prephenate dehydrogenase [Actinopolymorpha cephalotaxi]NYH83242.1 prephenate dehydrogenase [Actinopolymorpha cephalotaxi]SFG90759.1 prephenate dehydrogenase [Actinopolymorpha cephalotaxi]
MTEPPFRRVVVIGAGLMGTSVALALRRYGVEVLLEDADPGNLRVAVSLGAGVPVTPAEALANNTADSADLVVVGVPPSALGTVIADALTRFPGAAVTDLGSVKAAALAGTRAHASTQAGLDRYVGGHPMAGSEQSGPLAARADLFDGRAWAVTPHADSRPDAVAAVERLARTCGAFPVQLSPGEHDEAVALVSHLPQVASTVVAGLLTTAAEGHLVLAGQGLRDVTRIAGGDPELWTQILSANAEPVARLLHEAADNLHRVAHTLEKRDAAEAGLADLRTSLERGATGVRRLPGKHGARPEAFSPVPVLLPDQPGELARLFADVGAAGVNIEDVRIDHSPNTPAGLVELWVHEDAVPALLEALAHHGWDVHG